MKITTIFFDLGSTLVYSKDPWPPIYARADRAMIRVLQEAGVRIDSTSFFAEFGGFIQSYYLKTRKDIVELTAYSALRELLANEGQADVPDEVVRRALGAMYGVIQKNWFREQDAIPTLEKLKAGDFCLGLISNTSDDMNARGILEKEGMTGYFDSIVTSAALGIRKPDRRIFEVALNQLKVSPESAAMVGDLLEADVLGANQMGIYSIWIDRRVHMPEDGELLVQPQAVVSALDQIPTLLKDLVEEPQEGLA